MVLSDLVKIQLRGWLTYPIHHVLREKVEKFKRKNAEKFN